MELKSGLGPGARGGRAVTLGRNAEDVVVEGNEIGRLYRCFNALPSQHDKIDTSGRDLRCPGCEVATSPECPFLTALAIWCQASTTGDGVVNVLFWNETPWLA